MTFVDTKTGEITSLQAGDVFAHKEATGEFAIVRGFNTPDRRPIAAGTVEEHQPRMHGDLDDIDDIASAAGLEIEDVDISTNGVDYFKCVLPEATS